MRNKILLFTIIIISTLLVSRGNNELRIVKKIVTLKSDLVDSVNCTYQIEAFGDNITYEIEDDYIATVTPSGLITGKYCGKTHIYVNSDNGSAVMTITVEPTYKTFTEPKNLFGMDIKSVRDSIGSKFKMVDSLTTATECYLKYDSVYSSKAPECFYAFEINGKDTTLAFTSVCVDWKYYREASYFYGERYYVTKSNQAGSFFYAIDGKSPETCKKLITLQYAYPLYAIITYYPYKD